MITTFIWFIIGFVYGALPFSVWVGRLALRTDIRTYGDHNPGATNVIRAGGWQWGVLALLLDYFKGAIPVGVAHFFIGLEGVSLAVVAMAPVLGHTLIHRFWDFAAARRWRLLLASGPASLWAKRRWCWEYCWWGCGLPLLPSRGGP